MSLSPSEFNAASMLMKNVDKMQTIDELNRLLGTVMDQFSVTHLLCISAFGMPALQDRKPMFGFRDTKWVQHYRRNHYFADDALPQYALELKDWGEPFWWSDLVAEKPLTELQYRIFREAFDFGLKEGVVIPIPVVVDSNDVLTEYAYASIGGDIHKSDELENTLRLMVLAAHRTARRILMKLHKKAGRTFLDDPIVSFDPNVDISGLTPQELTVIRLYAGNDTFEQIAASASISVATVKTHLKNAREKLGFTSNKAMLVALMRHRSIS